MPRVNPKPLTILVTDPTMFGLATIQDFQNKGHTISLVDVGLIMEADVIIGPRCWRIDPRLKLGDDKTVEESLERQLDFMEKGIRAVKYPKENKDAK